jgi:hypothetical protein
MNMIMELLTELRTLIARHAESEAARQALSGIVLAKMHEPTEPFSYVPDPMLAWWRRGPSAPFSEIGFLTTPPANI